MHPTQPLNLFCLEDSSLLCIKCVTKHAGHTISDFEDACSTHLVPLLTTFKEQSQVKTAQLQEDLNQIRELQSALKEMSDAKCRQIESMANQIIETVKEL